MRQSGHSKDVEAAKTFQMKLGLTNALDTPIGAQGTPSYGDWKFIQKTWTSCAGPSFFISLEWWK